MVSSFLLIKGDALMLAVVVNGDKAKDLYR